jgi:hypothetical protein
MQVMPPHHGSHLGVPRIVMQLDFQPVGFMRARDDRLIVRRHGSGFVFQ